MESDTKKLVIISSPQTAQKEFPVLNNSADIQRYIDKKRAAQILTALKKEPTIE